MSLAKMTSGLDSRRIGSNRTCMLTDIDGQRCRLHRHWGHRLEGVRW